MVHIGENMDRRIHYSDFWSNSLWFNFVEYSSFKIIRDYSRLLITYNVSLTLCELSRYSHHGVITSIVSWIMMKGEPGSKESSTICDSGVRFFIVTLMKKRAQIRLNFLSNNLDLTRIDCSFQSLKLCFRKGKITIFFDI